MWIVHSAHTGCVYCFTGVIDEAFLGVRPANICVFVIMSPLGGCVDYQTRLAVVWIRVEKRARAPKAVGLITAAIRWLKGKRNTTG